MMTPLPGRARPVRLETPPRTADDTTQVARRVARQMIDRALANSTRPHTLTVAEATGLPGAEVERIIAAAVAARTPVITPSVQARVLLDTADRLTREATLLRRLARDLAAAPAGESHRCHCGKVFPTARGLATHQTRTHTGETKP